MAHYSSQYEKIARHFASVAIGNMDTSSLDVQQREALESAFSLSVRRLLYATMSQKQESPNADSYLEELVIKALVVLAEKQGVTFDPSDEATKQCLGEMLAQAHEAQGKKYNDKAVEAAVKITDKLRAYLNTLTDQIDPPTHDHYVDFCHAVIMGLDEVAHQHRSYRDAGMIFEEVTHLMRESIASLLEASNPERFDDWDSKLSFMEWHNFFNQGHADDKIGIALPMVNFADNIARPRKTMVLSAHREYETDFFRLMEKNLQAALARYFVPQDLSAQERVTGEFALLCASYFSERMARALPVMDADEAGELSDAQLAGLRAALFRFCFETEDFAEVINRHSNIRTVYEDIIGVLQGVYHEFNSSGPIASTWVERTANRDNDRNMGAS